MIKIKGDGDWKQNLLWNIPFHYFANYFHPQRLRSVYKNKYLDVIKNSSLSWHDHIPDGCHFMNYYL